MDNAVDLVITELRNRGFPPLFEKGILFVPTTGLVEKGLLRNMEPVSVVAISDTEGVRKALQTTISRGNPSTPHFSSGIYPAPIVLKHAGVRSWSAFSREAISWSIQKESGAYRIIGYRKHAKGYWEEDPEQKIEFPPGSTVDQVIDRTIAILQEAARGSSKR